MSSSKTLCLTRKSIPDSTESSCSSENIEQDQVEPIVIWDDSNGPNIQLQLADGDTYNELGSIVQAAKSLDPSTGKLVLKASFPNPNHLLLPNMYATVISPGEKLKKAILVPSRAILQIMDKNFIYVVNAAGVVEQKTVEVGATKGNEVIIKAGLAPGDVIIVDGLTKVKNGMKVNAKELTKDQLKATK